MPTQEVSRQIVQFSIYFFLGLGQACMNGFVDTFFYVFTGKSTDTLWAQGIAVGISLVITSILMKYFGLRIYEHDVAEKKFTETTQRFELSRRSMDHSKYSELSTEDDEHHK